MNRSDLRQLVAQNVGNRTDLDARINNMLDAALRKLSSEYLWDDLEVEATVTLVVGTASIALASDLVRLTEARYIDGNSSYSLKLRTKRWVLKRVPDPTSKAQGKPNYGYLQGKTLYFDRPPSEAKTLRYSYFRLHPNLTSDSSSTLILQADDAVVAYATYRTFKSIEKHEDAAFWLAEYAQLVRDAKRVDHDTGVVHVGEQRGEAQPWTADSWLDPFVKGVSGGS